MGLFETEAIVLRTYKLAEADKIVVCLTREAGVVRGVARGARRLKSRFGAGLEPFTHIQLSFYAKEGRELVSVRQTEILRSYFALAQNAETFAALEYLSELALEFAPPHEPNETLFRMLRACLEAVAAEPQRLKPIVRYYELWILRLAGFLPELRVCNSCRESLKSSEPAYLGMESALRCRRCASDLDTQVSTEARSLWGRMLRVSPTQWAQEVSEGSLQQTAQEELAQLTQRLITRALERLPRGRSAAHATLYAAESIRTE